MKIKRLSLVVVLALFINSCNIVIVLLSPSKQKIPDLHTTTPKKKDFKYENCILDSMKTDNYLFSTKTAYSLIDSNVYKGDGTYGKSCQCLVFWPTGHFYIQGYNNCKPIFNENKNYGHSGFYYISNDSIYTESFFSNGLGHGYYYETIEIIDSSTIRKDWNKWFYREPMRKKKYKLYPNSAEKASVGEIYELDTLTIYDINPIW